MPGSPGARTARQARLCFQMFLVVVALFLLKHPASLQLPIIHRAEPPVLELELELELELASPVTSVS